MSKVKFGLKNVHLAKRTVVEGVVSYATPVAFEGAKSLNADPQGDKKEFYYDDVVYYSTQSRAGMEGELEVADVPKSVLIDFLGYIEDTLGQLVQTSDTGESFALLFQVTTDTQARKMCFFNCSFGQPKEEYSSIEQDVELQNTVIPLKVHGENVDGKLITKAQADSTATNYDTFFNAVAVPTFTPPSP